MPDGQLVHASWEPVLYVPLVQDTHALTAELPVVEPVSVPAGQLTQDVLPTVVRLLYELAGQAAHATPEPAV